MKLLSRLSDTDQFDNERRYPLNPKGHFTTNLLTGFRRRTTRLHVQTQEEWVLEPLLTSANQCPNGSQGGNINEVNIIMAWSSA